MKDSQDHSAVGPAAGFLFQFERAFLHLAKSGKGAVIGIETDDDVALKTADGKVVWEQSKLSLQNQGHPFTDKSKNLWNTLGIWLAKLRQDTTPPHRVALYLVTNRPVPCCLARKLSEASRDDDLALGRCVDELKKCGTSEQSDVQKLMNSVLAFTDDELKAMISSIELIDAGHTTLHNSLRIDTTAALALPPGIDELSVYHELSGWIQDVVLNAWHSKRPAWIEFDVFNNRKYLLVMDRLRPRVLERPETAIVVTDADRTNAECEHFVDHLNLITLDGDDIASAIDDYLRFNIEYSRLLQEGDVGGKDWDAFFSELTRRWRNLFRRALSTNQSPSREVLGQDILFDTIASQYRPVLAGIQTVYDYFAAGGYHRLANADHVWWHPDYSSKEQAVA